MIFVTGGKGAGKRSFTLDTLGYSLEDLSPDPYSEQPVLVDLSEMIRTRGSFDAELETAVRSKEVIICDEVGCGVVPISSEERAWRDEVGRAATMLASEAQLVVRMICGIPQVIKGSLGTVDTLLDTQQERTGRT